LSLWTDSKGRANSPVDCLPGRGFFAKKRIRPPRCFSFG